MKDDSALLRLDDGKLRRFSFVSSHFEWPTVDDGILWYTWTNLTNGFQTMDVLRQDDEDRTATSERCVNQREKYVETDGGLVTFIKSFILMIVIGIVNSMIQPLSIGD